VWAKFWFGARYYKNLYAKNRRMATITLQNILSKHFPDHAKTITENPNMPWPSNLNFINFQNKVRILSLKFLTSVQVIEQIRLRLDVSFPNNSIQNFKCVDELISALETCPRTLKLKWDPTDDPSLNTKNPKQPKIKPMNFIHFIMNVPSDYFRVLHPKMAVSKSIENSVKKD